MPDSIQEALDEAPATAAGAQAAWFLTRLWRRGEGARAQDRERYAPDLVDQAPVGPTDAEAVEVWRGLAERFGDILALTIESKSETHVEARVGLIKDRNWKFDLEVEPEPPHRITRINWERLHAFKLDVREATQADAAVLVDVERRCPIVLEDSRLWFDRGDRYFDFSRLMEDCTVGLASVDGEPAAVTCGSRHTVRIGGALKTIITVSHLRVLPEHQRKGLWGAANQVLDKYWPQVDGSNAYIAVDNAGMQHGFRTTPDKWPEPFLWARLASAERAGPAFGRPATPADAPWLVEQLNAFHGDEEMFVPYTEARLTARLERAPDLYGWDRVWIADGAAVGVWPAGRAQRLVTERGGTQSISQPGVVLDYAFAPDSEAAFEGLLRAWCGWLAERDMDRMNIFTSKASRGVALLTSLAGEVEAFNMWTPGIPVPPDAATRGLYVDPIYF